MRKFRRRALSALVVLAAAAFLAPTAMAADHLDAPTSEADPAADINDLYVFESTDDENPLPGRTVLVTRPTSTEMR